MPLLIGAGTSPPKRAADSATTAFPGGSQNSTLPGMFFCQSHSALEPTYHLIHLYAKVWERCLSVGKWLIQNIWMMGLGQAAHWNGVQLNLPPQPRLIYHITRLLFTLIIFLPSFCQGSQGVGARGSLTLVRGMPSMQRLRPRQFPGGCGLYSPFLDFRIRLACLFCCLPHRHKSHEG